MKKTKKDSGKTAAAQGDIMSDVMTWINNAPAGIDGIGAFIAALPPIENRSPEQQRIFTAFADMFRQAGRINTAADMAGIDYAAERETFLQNAGRTDSEQTRASYRRALDRLETWASREKIKVLSLTPAQADNFIYSLRGRAPASIRLDVSACSSFFAWLERRHAGINNPFRGTRARPAKNSARKTEIPEAADVALIIQSMPPEVAAAAAIMAYRGLRAGALPSLSITGGNYTTHTKGQDKAGKMPTAVIDTIKKAGLPLRAPFAEMLKSDNPDQAANTLEKRITYYTRKLHKAGKIPAAYSAHDLRHFYAVTEYRKDKDIHRVSRLLGHASIQVTDTYLKGLGEIE
jgi:site-specific recombinase XerD